MSGIRASILCIAMLACAHAPALGECLTGWWWPPQEIAVSPAEPEVGEPVEITVSGIWLDTCTPNASDQRVVESQIGIDVIQQFDTCDRFCGDALTPWSVTEVVEELDAGTYEICATLFDPACQPEPCTPCTRIGTLVVFCPGDLDGDGDADLADLTALLAHFGMEVTSRAEGDVNHDGLVDLDDLTRLLSNFGRTC